MEMPHKLYLLHLYSAKEGAYQSHCYFTKGNFSLDINIPSSFSQINLNTTRYLFTFIHTVIQLYLTMQLYRNVMCSFNPLLSRTSEIQAEISH